MKKNFEFPNKIPVFPLSNFIIFPETTVPLNIFEPRYIQMIDDCMKGNRLIGIVQPKKTGDLKKPDLYDVGCVGKITSFNETEDGRYLIVINGINTINHDIIPKPFLHKVFKPNDNIIITTNLRKAVLYIPLNISITICVVENTIYRRAGAQILSKNIYYIIIF